MNPLKKFANKFLNNGNSTKNKKTNTVDKILGAKAKIMKYGIIAGVAAFLVAIIAILAVVSYFLGFVQGMVEDASQFVEEAGERISNSFTTGCILCSTEDLEKIKEEQFQSRISVIKDVFGDQVDDVVLASTVLFQGDYYEVIDSQYDDNYNESEYTDFWNDMKNALRSFTDSSIDGYNGITSEEINLIDAATIVMVESNVDGKYNEDSYKHALTINGFVDDPIRNGMICFTEQTKNLLDTILDTNPFKMAYDVLTQGTRDSLPDNALRMVNTADICANGYIGGTFDHIATIQDENTKQVEKESIAQNIIDFAKFYRYLFPEEEECVYGGSTATGDMVNWRQCGQSWSNLSVGTGGSVCAIGCTSTSMAFLIAKSGTKLTLPSMDPGVFVKNAYYQGSALSWSFTHMAPNFKTVGGFQSLNTSNYVQRITEAINTPNNGHQQYVIIKYGGGGNTHWVAVDHVENGKVYIMDPAAEAGVGLIEMPASHYGRPVSGMRVFVAEDVPFGSGISSSGSSSSTTLDVTSSTYQDRLESSKRYYQCSSELGDVTIQNDSKMCTSGCIISSLMGIRYLYTGEAIDVNSFISDVLKEGLWQYPDAAHSSPYFDSDSNSPILTENWGLSAHPIGANLDSIKSTLNSGKKVLVNIGVNGGTYSTNYGHYLVLDHINPDTGQIYVWDPNGSANRNGYKADTEIQSQILAYAKNGPWEVTSTDVSNDDLCEPTGDSSLEDLAGLVAYLEGAPTCNYHGQGANTGYSSYNLGDGAGMTSAFGITMGTGASYANEVGYSSYASDMSSGCTDKNYMDQIFAKVLGNYVEQTRALVTKAGLNLTETQIMALTSITYNTGAGGGITKVIKTIQESGADSVDVWNCMVRRGCSYTTRYNLSSRRAAEYEAYNTGNFNAAKPNESYNALTSINTDALLTEYKNTHWPTSR